MEAAPHYKLLTLLKLLTLFALFTLFTLFALLILPLLTLLTLLTILHCLHYLEHKVELDRVQSRKNPVSASAMLTGKFLQIRKVFGTSSLLAEEFLDTLQYKISR